MPTDTDWMQYLLSQGRQPVGAPPSTLNPAILGLQGQQPASPITNTSPISPQPGNNIMQSLAGAVAPPPAPPSTLQTAQSMVPPPKTPEQFSATLQDGTKVTGPDFNNWLQTHQQNPSAAALLELHLKGKQAQDTADWMTQNAPPQQQHVSGGPMPQLQQTPVPQQGQAHLNPLAVALGLATAVVPGYGNPAQAVANQVQGAMQQTHANFETAMQRHAAQADEAMAQFRAAMETHDQGLRESAINNDIDTSNANSQYQNRKNAAGQSIEANAINGPDGLHEGLTAISQAQMDHDAVTEAANRAAAEPGRYLGQLGQATDLLGKAATTDAKVQTTAADVNLKGAQALQYRTGAAKNLGDLQQTAQKLQFGQDLHQGDLQKQLLTNQKLQADIHVAMTEAAKNLAQAGSANATASKTRSEIGAGSNGGLKITDLEGVDRLSEATMNHAGQLVDTAQQRLSSAQQAMRMFNDMQDKRRAAQPGSNGFLGIGAKPAFAPSTQDKATYAGLQKNLAQAQATYDGANAALGTARQGYQQTHSIIMQHLNARIPGLAGGQGGGTPLDPTTAQSILKEAGGNVNKAAALAQQRGYKF